jgi:4a-hydroxytetrahydrobiopterin dehydratase
MTAHLLNPVDLASLGTALPNWQQVAGKLHRDLVFADFVEAFAFMTKVALIAEAMEHHPEWTNVWNRVSIDLVTHDMGGLSNLDVQLAQRIDGLTR